MLGHKIKELRLKMNLSQKDLGNLLNMENSTISNYENGNRVPSFEALIKFAQFFDVSVDFLLGRTIDEREDIKTLLNIARESKPKNIMIAIYLLKLLNDGD